MPEVVIIKLSSTPCGKVMLEGLVKLGAVSARNEGAVAKSRRIAAASTFKTGRARDENRGRRRRGRYVNMARKSVGIAGAMPFTMSFALRRDVAAHSDLQAGLT